MRLDAIRNGLEQALRADSHLDNFLALGHVCFIWGDVRATTPEQRLEAYDRGRQAAKRAMELAPRNPAAHFWFATNTARWGQTKGVVRSLFLLPTVQEEIRIILDLDPRFTAVYALAGNVYYEVPGLLGGDLAKAEQMFRKGLAQDPKFTGLRVGLAKTLMKKGRIAEARRELQAVLAEPEPRNPADWTMKDAREARQLLESIKAKEGRARPTISVAATRAPTLGTRRLRRGAPSGPVGSSAPENGCRRNSSCAQAAPRRRGRARPNPPCRRPRLTLIGDSCRVVLAAGGAARCPRALPRAVGPLRPPAGDEGSGRGGTGGEPAREGGKAATGYPRSGCAARVGAEVFADRG